MSYTLVVFETPAEIFEAFADGTIPRSVFLVNEGETDEYVRFSGDGSERFSVDNKVRWQWILEVAVKKLHGRIHFT